LRIKKVILLAAVLVAGIVLGASALWLLTSGRDTLDIDVRGPTLEELKSQAATATPDRLDDTEPTVVAPPQPTAESSSAEAAGTVEQEFTESDSPAIVPASSDFDAGDLDLLFEVWDLVQSEFDGDLPIDTDIAASAIMGSLGSLGDRYTRFFPRNQAVQQREDLEGGFEGIGAYVDLDENGYLVIVRPIPGQPAELAGMESGDLIIAVNGESVVGLALDEIIDLVRGPRGSTVELTVMREGLAEPFLVDIERRLVEIPVVMAELIDGEFAHVRLSSFNARATAQLEQAIEEMIDAGAQGLIDTGFA